MKNSERLEQKNQKISQLQKMQKQLETKYIENITKKITKVLIKKQAFKINKKIGSRLASFFSFARRGKLQEPQNFPLYD